MALDSIFYEIAILIMVASAVGFAGLALRQPLIVAFIAVGVIVGPDVLGLVSSTDFIETLAKISIAVLLFLVGLKLDVSLVRSLGRVAVATGLGQVLFTAVIGFAICLLLGISPLVSVYIAVALTFSSTIIIVKLLSDKQEIGALHGKIALGFLIVQDIFVVLAMVVLSTIGVGVASDAGAGQAGQVLRLVGGGLVLIGLSVAFIKYAAEPLLSRIAKSSELLVIFAVGWAAGLAAAADVIGFGKELGGLLAGVTLASTQYRDAIGSRLASLRDFLLLFFFIDLGGSLNLSTLGDQMGAALVLSAFVLIGNPLIVMAIMGYMGYRRRTGFLAGLTVAQISEFSLIFMAMGISIGHVPDSAMGLVTLVGLVTIALSVYMITWSHQLFALFEPYLGLFERKQPFREPEGATADSGDGKVDYLIFGLGRYGCNLGRELSARGYSVLGVDHDPAALTHWRAMGLRAEFGDAADPEFAGHMDLNGVYAAIIAISPQSRMLTEADPQIAAIHGLKAAGFRGKLAVAVGNARDADLLEGHGADIVLMPYEDAAIFAVDRLTGIREEEARPA